MQGCLRRSWLLGELSAVLDRNCSADGRLFELLALEDEGLIAALGGRRREELARRHARLRERDAEPARGSATVCVHDERFPRRAAIPGRAPPGARDGRARSAAGAGARADDRALGTARASAYGIEIARGLARELAASGVTLVTERRADRVAAQEGVAEAGGAAVLISGDGLGAPAPRARDETYARLASAGCTVSELRARRGGVAGVLRRACGSRRDSAQ